MSRTGMKTILAMVRPPAALVLLIFAALGMAQAGEIDKVHPLFTTVLLILAAGFTNATCLNDITDESIDRVNFAGGGSRPLVEGSARPNELFVIAAVAGAASLLLGWSVDWRVGLVVGAGLLLNVAYSMPPMRLADRGGLATALLPLGYVVVPFLVGAFSAAPTLSREGFLLMAGLYLSFAGRIILKDFRDVEGDARFGKRTFLLRHGRLATCRASAGLWLSGALFVPLLFPGSALLPASAVLVASILWALHRLAGVADKDRQLKIIWCIACAGRGLSLLMLTGYTLESSGWTAAAQAWFVAALTLSIAGLFYAEFAKDFAAADTGRARRESAGLRI
jgi:4-hydroxybenzoate polyprenyltransferase